MKNAVDLPQDEVLLQQLVQTVLQNLENEQFGVEELSEKVGMSRSHLHRKLKLLKGQSVSQFIREVRLEEAMKLLQNDVATTAEIAYRVGFKSPSYFCKCFHKHYGYPPGEIKKQTLRITSLKSIAVLPFENISNDANQEYFCDGITEEIINALTQVENLKVIARTSSFVFKGKHEDIREIGKKLGVVTVLEGSIRKSGNKLRISAQLINVEDGFHLWSEKYDRAMKDIFDIQDEISLAIVEKLKIQLFGEDRKQVLRSQTQNLEAYQYYLKGRFYWNKRTKEDLEKSIEYFEQSIEADPDYALAYTGLADAYIILADWGYFSPIDIHPKAKKLILKSLEIDNKLAETYTSLAYLNGFIEWKWEEAERNFKKAFECNPNYPTAHQWYALYLLSTGRLTESLKQSNHSRELDPLSVSINFANGIILCVLKQDDEAINQLKKILLINKNFGFVYIWTSLIYLQKGKHAKAVKEYQHMLSIDPLTQKYVSVAGDIYEKSGIKGFLQWVIEKTPIIYPGNYNDPFFIATYYAALGDKEKALTWLEQGVERHAIWIVYTIKSLPVFDSLRTDPGFLHILDKMGLR